MTRQDYPAVTIEHRFAQLLAQPIGQRDEAWDADSWRDGNKTRIEIALRRASARISTRLRRAGDISTADATTFHGLVNQFNQEADAVRRTGSEPNNPRWVTLSEYAQQAHDLLRTYGV